MMAMREESKRILLVDDSRDSADVMAELFHYMGHETQRAYEGIDALAIAAWFSPQVIIPDLSMPNMDGLAVSRALRRMPNVCDAAIIILTGFWGRTAAAAEKRGVDLVMMKPANLENVLSGMHAVIRMRQQGSGAAGWRPSAWPPASAGSGLPARR
ncbi:two-component system CheB/CheR fusion protein [Pseudoduganella lurida]|uniref:Two-component system CheB/CheR fusion protein n=1 Tax=Pseudoduganella lurida TaxID=1036180 RepID=A0A562R0I3_9BURK|nr:response regulator [Pseudoduganella lurida]TWI62588.1 two-component system CheB/CheR fusion protein [Pseudoduganella lurida]